MNDVLNFVLLRKSAWMSRWKNSSLAILTFHIELSNSSVFLLHVVVLFSTINRAIVSCGKIQVIQTVLDGEKTMTDFSSVLWTTTVVYDNDDDENVVSSEKLGKKMTYMPSMKWSNKKSYSLNNYPWELSTLMTFFYHLYNNNNHFVKNSQNAYNNHEYGFFQRFTFEKEQRIRINI